MVFVSGLFMLLKIRFWLSTEMEKIKPVYAPKDFFEVSDTAHCVFSKWMLFMYEVRIIQCWIKFDDNSYSFKFHMRSVANLLVSMFCPREENRLRNLIQSGPKVQLLVAAKSRLGRQQIFSVLLVSSG